MEDKEVLYFQLDHPSLSVTKSSSLEWRLNARVGQSADVYIKVIGRLVVGNVTSQQRHRIAVLSTQPEQWLALQPTPPTKIID